jgi:hypothetical protein
MLPWLCVDDPLWIGESRRVSVLAVRISNGGGGDGDGDESIALAAASLEVHARSNELRVALSVLYRREKNFLSCLSLVFLISFLCRQAL